MWKTWYGLKKVVWAKEALPKRKNLVWQACRNTYGKSEFV